MPSIELDSTNELQGAKLKVIGVGGGGGNAVNNMISTGLNGVGFVAANTDNQALERNQASVKIQLGNEITRGLGAGGDNETGSLAAEESSNDIKQAISDSDMVFVTAGMGGGTGTGGAPVIAKLAKDAGALVVGIVTKPFTFEGKKRIRTADNGISKLREEVDALIVIPNQRLLEIIDKNTSFKEAFKKVDEVLYNATRGISDIIGKHGIVNVDFADVRAVMKGMGDALMGIGIASGEDRARLATENALNSPLLDGVSIKGAKGVLVNITGGSNMGMMEIAEAVSIIEDAAGDEANIIHGVVENSDMNEEIMVTVVATGFNSAKEEAIVNEETVEQELPFPKKIKQSKDKIEKNGRETVLPKGFNFGGSNYTKKIISRGFKDQDINKVPRGTEALKLHNIPAYERRDKTNGIHKEVEKS